VGQSVTILAVVTARKLNGFFLQMPDAQADADPTTSEGIFVFTSSAPSAAAAVGNEVLVGGTVVEFVPSSDPFSPPTTEIVGPTVTLYSSSNLLPAAVSLTAMPPSASGPIDQLERFEGMRVSVDSLTAIAPTQGSVAEPNATSTSNGVFYGVITGTARPFREPGIETPNTPPPGSACCIPVFDANPERIRVDSDAQLGASTIEVTTGAVITGLVGPLDYGFRTYTIVPDPGLALAVSGNAVATPVPAQGAGQFTISSFNMERFFNDAAEPGPSVPVLTPTAFQNRLSKASLIIRDILRSPDIIGVEEVENLASLQAVASRVNADAVSAGDPDPDYQAYLEEGNDIGGIDSGFLVKASRVSVLSVAQEGKTATYINPVDGLPALLNDRPPLVLRASILPPLGPAFPVTVVVNHLRSLNGAADADGRVRAKRAAQAEFLANLIQARQVADPNDHIVSLGDYNAFQFNDGYGDTIGTVKGAPTPPDNVVLSSPDLVDPDLEVLDAASPEQRYSYVFDGNAQELDHILITQNLFPRFDALEYGRVDADFPETYRGDPLRPERLSDHDPAVAYFSFPPNTSPVADAGLDASYPAAASDCAAAVTLDGGGSQDADGDALTYTWTGPFGVATGLAPTVLLGPGVHDITLTVDDGRGGSSTDVVRVTVSDVTPPSLTLIGGGSMVVELGDAFADPGAVADDACAGDLTSAIVVTGSVNTGLPGSYPLVYSVGDGDNTTQVTRTVEVKDSTDPDIAAVTPSPHVLWPPNGRMMKVAVGVSVTDASGASACRITTVSSDERPRGTTPDWLITGDLTLQLRAERDGRGDGRTYTITVECRDVSGNEALGTGTVIVPHDRGRGGPRGDGHHDGDGCERQRSPKPRPKRGRH
jgi:hypothetical protein